MLGSDDGRIDRLHQSLVMKMKMQMEAFSIKAFDSYCIQLHSISISRSELIEIALKRNRCSSMSIGSLILRVVLRFPVFLNTIRMYE
jgi:hypothetical protein